MEIVYLFTPSPTSITPSPFSPSLLNDLSLIAVSVDGVKHHVYFYNLGQFLKYIAVPKPIENLNYFWHSGGWL